MASKCRNMFYENKKQETTEIVDRVVTKGGSHVGSIFRSPLQDVAQALLWERRQQIRQESSNMGSETSEPPFVTTRSIPEDSALLTPAAEAYVFYYWQICPEDEASKCRHTAIPPQYPTEGC
ncbi:hypothetical protein AAG570_007919 [Ranatra chinensis]|uniref:Uncharacterized protein n=1 Tax=Ranatra chinensis TaxID=642074 RepID=A0ABD0Y6J2_9HEMI